MLKKLRGSFPEEAMHAVELNREKTKIRQKNPSNTATHPHKQGKEPDPVVEVN